MKPNIIPRTFMRLTMAILLTGSPTAVAQVDATAWTSIKGTTIWARLEGIDGDKVILHMRGKTYRVPMSRLSPKSIEKMGQMLELPPDKIRSIAGSKPSARSARTTIARGNALEALSNSPMSRSLPELPPVGDFAITDLPENEKPATPAGMTDSVARPAGLEITGTLPVLTAAADSDEAGFGAVLPPRGSVEGHKPPTASGIRLEGRRAIAPLSMPSVILKAIEAGNRLQTKAYKWGGGRARLEDSGYDCSGSVSYVLIKAGLLGAPLNSSSFTRFGAPGRGRWITIYARHGHVFMTICGLRLDTGGSGGRGESGPRWRTHMRGTSGFVMRHPPGF